MPTGLIHGDLFPDNVIMTADGLAMIDFEEGAIEHQLFDVGMAVMGFCWNDGLVREHLDALLEGYRHRRFLAPPEKERLADYTRMAAIATLCWHLRGLADGGRTPMGRDNSVERCGKLVAIIDSLADQPWPT